MAKKIKRTKITNPFYGRVMREGIHVIGDPALTANRTEITNPYFKRLVNGPRPNGRSMKGN